MKKKRFRIFWLNGGREVAHGNLQGKSYVIVPIPIPINEVGAWDITGCKYY